MQDTSSAAEVVDWTDRERRQRFRAVVMEVFLAKGITEPDREDLLQEVWIQAFLARDSYAPDRGTAAQWLAGIARNLAYKHLTRERRRARREALVAGRQEISAGELLSPGLTPEQGAYAKELVCHIAEAPEARPMHARIYPLRAQGRTDIEIAKALEMPLHKTKRALRDAVSALRKLLAKLRESSDRPPSLRFGSLLALLWTRSETYAARLRCMMGLRDRFAALCPMPRGRRGLLFSGAALAVTLFSAPLALGLAPTAPFSNASSDSGRCTATRNSQVPVSPRRAPRSYRAEQRGSKAPVIPSAHLLEQAWHRLRDGAPLDALALLREHAARFPREHVAFRTELEAKARAALRPQMR